MLQLDWSAVPKVSFWRQEAPRVLDPIKLKGLGSPAEPEVQCYIRLLYAS